MDKIWAHEPYATFIGPLSTTVWSAGTACGKGGLGMRFSQFDRGHISVAESTFTPMQGGLGRGRREKVQLCADRVIPQLPTPSDERVRNQDGRWLMVSHKQRQFRKSLSS